DALILYPRDGQSVQWHLRWLCATAQLRLIWPPRDSLALLFYEPRTGRLVQRVNLRVAAPRVELECRYSVPSIVPRVGRQSLSLEQSEPAVRVCHEGMIIVWDGNAWALNSAFALSGTDP